MALLPAGIVVRFLSIGLLTPPRLERGVQLRLGTVTARPVEPLTRHLRGEVFLRHPSLWGVVRIDVALSVAQRLGAAVVGVPEMHRHRTDTPIAYRCRSPTERSGNAVRLGC